MIPFVKMTLAFCLAAAPSISAFAQLPAPEGPIIFGPYTQNQLDATYDQAFWRNDPPETTQRSVAISNDVRSRFGEPTRLAYGSSSNEMLDIYTSSARGKSPVMVFIHGGAWRGGVARTSAGSAEMFMEAGAHYIALDFVNVLQNNGNLMEMADQVRRALIWTYNNAHSFDGDRRQLYVSGHSSGGHLCGVAMTTDWTKYGMPRDMIKGGVCSSAMYDLTPVALSSRRTYVNFTPDVVQQLSPVFNLQHLVSPIVVGHGTKESPEFIRQSKDFVQIARAAGKKVVYVEGVGHNHFEFPETLGNPYGYLGREALSLMGLEPHGARGPGRKNKHN